MYIQIWDGYHKGRGDTNKRGQHTVRSLIFNPSPESSVMHVITGFVERIKKAEIILGSDFRSCLNVLGFEIGRDVQVVDISSECCRWPDAD
jgi:hypothetical protein